MLQLVQTNPLQKKLVVLIMHLLLKNHFPSRRGQKKELLKLQQRSNKGVAHKIIIHVDTSSLLGGNCRDS
jgi:hypothetical protein